MNQDLERVRKLPRPHRVVLGPLTWPFVILVTFSACSHKTTVAGAAAPSSATIPKTQSVDSSSWPRDSLARLQESGSRKQAIKELKRGFDEIATHLDDLERPDRRALVDEIVRPLTVTYVAHYADLDITTRGELAELLYSLQDSRTLPAFIKAFNEFAEEPASSESGTDLLWAARTAALFRDERLADPLLRAFTIFRASSALGDLVFRDLNEAMVGFAHASWLDPLTAKLEAGVTPPRSAEDRQVIDAYRDQLFWQVTAAEVLGKLRDPSGVAPLVKVMLDPRKADIQTTALSALVRLGKPATAAAIRLLEGQDKHLIDFSTNRSAKSSRDTKDRAHMRTAALVLGAVGRSDALPSLMAAARVEASEGNRAVIARELVKIPATIASKRSFKRVFESISHETLIPPGMVALPTLAEAAAKFFDPSLVPWLLREAATATGSPDDRKAFQQAIVVTVLKLATPDQLETARRAVESYGTQIERSFLELAEEELQSCGKRVACYLTSLQKRENQDPKRHFAGVKAAYMIGIFGEEKNRDDVIAILNSVHSPTLRFTAALVIDHLAPNGAPPSAEKLREILGRAAENQALATRQNDLPLLHVLARMEARAQ